MTSKQALTATAAVYADVIANAWASPDVVALADGKT